MSGDYSVDRATEMTERIYGTTERVLSIASKDAISTAKAADRLAEERISSVRGIKEIYRG